MHTRVIAVVAVLLLAFSYAPSATAEDRVAVWVDADCDNNTVGQRLIYNVKEAFRSSSRFSVAQEYKDSSLQLQLVCLAPASYKAGLIVHYAYAITVTNFKGYYDYLVTFGVGNCGSDRVASCAESHVAGVDRALDDVFKRINDGTFERK